MSRHGPLQVGDMVTWEDPRECDRAFIGRRRELHGDGPFRVRAVKTAVRSLVIIEKDGRPISEGDGPSEWDPFWFRKV